MSPCPVLHDLSNGWDWCAHDYLAHHLSLNGELISPNFASLKLG